MRAKALLDELITKHPEWNWEDLEDQGFYEIMQAFRHAPEGDQQSVILSFTLVKEFIRRLISLEEKKVTSFTPQKLVYTNRLYNNGYNTGIKEYQLRAKKKKTHIEKKYLEIMNQLAIDLQTVMLISSFTNGHGWTKEEIVQWAKKQYAQNKNNSDSDYYRWLGTFIEKLSTEDFSLFINKKSSIELFNKSTLIPPKPQNVRQKAVGRATVGTRATLEHKRKRLAKILPLAK